MEVNFMYLAAVLLFVFSCVALFNALLSIEPSKQSALFSIPVKTICAQENCKTNNK